MKKYKIHFNYDNNYLYSNLHYNFKKQKFNMKNSKNDMVINNLNNNIYNNNSYIINLIYYQNQNFQF